MEKQKTECPVCNQAVPLATINDHVDRCLHKDAYPGLQKGKKRQSLLNFGNSPPSTGEVRVKRRKLISDDQGDSTRSQFKSSFLELGGEGG